MATLSRGYIETITTYNFHINSNAYNALFQAPAANSVVCRISGVLSKSSFGTGNAHIFIGPTNLSISADGTMDLAVSGSNASIGQKDPNGSAFTAINTSASAASGPYHVFTPGATRGVIMFKDLIIPPSWFVFWTADTGSTGWATVNRIDASQI